MIDLEGQLRQEMQTEAARVERESVRPLRDPAPRRRSRLVLWLAPVTAAAAVAGLIAGVTVASQNAGKVLNAALPAGAPKYYVTLENARDVVTAVVRSSADGAPISSVQLLRSRTLPQPLAITGAADNRSFLVTVDGRLEILRLATDGHVLGLTHLPAIAGLEAIGAGLSPDGTEVVVATGPLSSCRSCAPGIALYSVSTGTTKKWLLPKGDQDVWGPVNWPGKGHEVLLSAAPDRGLRALDVTAPAGNLLAASRAIHRPDPLPTQVQKQGWVANGENGWLMPGDKTLFTSYARLSTLRHRGATNSIETARILEVSASTGALVRVLARFSSPVPADAGIGCLPVSFGPSGVHVLMWCNNGFGRLDGSHFTALPGPSKDLAGMGTAAW